MKPTTKVAIAGLLSAAGAVLTAFATEFGGETPEASAPADAPAKPKKQKQEKAAPVSADTPAEVAVPVEEPTEEGPKGKTYEELKALIAGPVKDGQRLEVKKIIAKYDPDSNPPSLKTIPAKNHAAFEKDLQALSY